MRRDEVFVSPDWLHERVGHPDVLPIDGSWYLPTMMRDGEPRDGKREFDAAHIPGAVFFDLDANSRQDTDLPHMMPDPIAFSSAMRKLGVGDGMTLVVYDGAGLFSAPRVWWMLKVMGARDVYILDGGLPAWEASDFPISDEPTNRSPRHFTARLDGSAIADLAMVQKAVGDEKLRIVDARPKDRFEGTVEEPRPGLRAGHISGAQSLPFTDLIQDGRLKSTNELQAVFASAGISTDGPIIASCGSGVSAVTLSLGLAIAGAGDVRIYDGSWAEWGADTSLPMETGPANA